MFKLRHIIWALLISLPAINVVSASIADTSEYLSAFGSTGINYSRELWPELNGSTVKMGLVEPSQSGSSQPDTFDFMPDLDNLSTTNINLLDIYSRYNHGISKSTHATMIAGLLWGHDYQNNALGIVPEALVSIYEAEWFIFYCVIGQETRTLDTDVLSLSWGTQKDDRFTQWWQRGIDKLAERENIVIVAAAGNGDAINRPSSSYNVISVGAADCPSFKYNLIDYVTKPNKNDSSLGPVDNHRCKPDIIAPGVFVGPTANNETLLLKKPCSSFAVPYVSGAAGMLIDSARKNLIAGGDDAKLVKSLLLSGANKLTGWHKGLCNGNDDTFIPLDYQQGAGLLDVSRALDILHAGKYKPDGLNEPIGWDIDTLYLDRKQGKFEKNYIFDTPLQLGQNFTATLCWNKHFTDDRSHQEIAGTILMLTLWAVNDQGIMDKSAPLDVSLSINDNLQHIYYHNEIQDQKVSLTVTVLDGDAVNVGQENFALSYIADYNEFTGDQLSGDVNNDGIVNIIDYAEVFSAIDNPDFANCASEKFFYQYDLNFDCTVDHNDLQIIFDNFTKTSPWINNP
ncbi:MAG: S8 family serine peptidase [Phycisphaerae bacterium]|nr:S8 family serine peptidase [Phycisphaerae bacterium]